MKQILIIDEMPLFREYLRVKLNGNGVEATAAVNGLDGIAKIRSLEPDLVIIDYNLRRQGCMELLKQKRASPGLARIPVIVLAQPLDQKRIIDLLSYNVKKVFTKPVKIDALFATLSELLDVSFQMDTSPGVVEVHVNEDIIFVEITGGLNRDKLELLYYKIIELIELYQIKVPKLIVMLSGCTLGPADAPAIEILLKSIRTSSKATLQHLRILTKDEFFRSYIQNHREYSGIEAATNLQDALDGLLSDLDGAESGVEEAALLGDRVLKAEDAVQGQSMQLRFDGEIKATVEDVKDSLEGLHIAAVDDDEVIRELVKHTFAGFDMRLSLFADGAEFIAALDREHFDLVLLDILMPRADGFAVLRELKDRSLPVPVIILSTVSQRETVIRAFQMGGKSYLSKPLKPADIFKKTLEILRVNY